MFVSAWLLFRVSSCCALALALRDSLRVNRALRATHSRRQVNHFIAEGRIVVNGLVVTSPDDRLVAGDEVKLDDCVVAWEEKDLPCHRYLKYNKPRGVVCTTDPRVPGNVLDALEQQQQRQMSNVCTTDNTNSTNTRRVYPIGRLDAESTGLILLTSDGGIVNPLLRTTSENNKTKVKE